MSMKYRRILRIFSWLVILAFGMQEFSHAAVPLSAIIRKPIHQSTLQQVIQDPSLLEIPHEFATVQEIHQGTNDRLIIHIQDAHSNLSGQEKLIFGAWANEYIMGINRVTFSARQGLLDSGFAVQVERRLKWFFKYPGMGQWWRDADRHPVPAQFETNIDAALSDVEQSSA